MKFATGNHILFGSGMYRTWPLLIHFFCLPLHYEYMKIQNNIMNGIFQNGCARLNKHCFLLTTTLRFSF